MRWSAVGMTIGGVRHVADIRADDLVRDSSAHIGLQMGYNKGATQTGMTMGGVRHAADIRADDLTKDGAAVIGLQMGTNKGATQAGMTIGTYSGAARGEGEELPAYGWTSKNYVICVCFHCRGTSLYHTTNTLQGRRAKSHVDTQTIQPGLGDFVLTRPPTDPYLTSPCYRILAAPLGT